MNSQQTQKLKELIKDSSILSDHERKEWLALLELMNDKQSIELEKILSEGHNGNLTAPTKASNVFLSGLPLHQPVRSLPMPVSPVAQAAKSAISPPQPKAKVPTTTSQVNAPLPSAKAPPLSHILNLPKNWGNKEKGDNNKSLILNPSSLTKDKNQREPINKKQGFAKKIEQIVKEKELPAGHEEFELELPVPGKNIVLPIQPPPPKKPGQDQIIINLNLNTQEQETQAVKKIQDNITVNLNPPAKKIDSPIPKPVPVPAVRENSPIAVPPIRPVAIPKKPITETPTMAPGLKLEDKDARARQETIAALKGQMAQPKQPTSAATLEKISRLSLNSHTDLAKLSMPEAEILEAPELIARIRQIILRAGYFEVIFQLEKSPAYKDYLETGVKLLSANGNFEENKPTGSGITKRQFEGFADLLRKIQAA